MRGIKKGAVTPEAANQKFKAWLEDKVKMPNPKMVMRDWRINEPVKNLNKLNQQEDSASGAN